MLSKKDIKKILLVFLCSRIPLLFFLLISKNLNIYDSIHYLNIAKNGYTGEILYAFFPLFPLTIKILHLIIPSYYISGMILSNIFSLLATIVLYLLIDNEKNKMIAILLFTFSPILGYTSIAYTESLYLFLSLLSFYFYKKKKILLCSLLVGLTMLTRNSGIILFGAIGLDLLIKWIKKETSLKQIILFAIPAIIIGSIFPIYLYFQTGDAFSYITTQKTVWKKISCNMFTELIYDILFIIKNKKTFIVYVFLQNWGFFAYALICAIKNIKKEFMLSIYTIVSLIAFTITCRDTSWDVLPSISLFRYVLSLFPVYLYVLKKENNRPISIHYILLLIVSISNALLIYLNVFLA